MKLFLDYLTAHSFVGFSFPQIETHLNAAGLLKKKPIGLPHWKSIKKTRVLPQHRAFALITGHESNITVIDFDSVETYKRITRDYPALREALTAKTPRCYHVFCKYDPEVATTTNCFGDLYPNVDIRNDDAIVFSYPTTYQNCETKRVEEYSKPTGTLGAFPFELKKHLISVRQPRKVRSPKQHQRTTKRYHQAVRWTMSAEDVEELKALLDCLPAKYFTQYELWFRVGAIIHYESCGSEEGLALFATYSRKGCGYENQTIQTLRDTWKRYSYRVKQATIATLFHWCQSENPETYLLILARRSVVPEQPMFLDFSCE